MKDLFGSIVKKLLAEGSRDKALSVFLPLFQKRGIEMSQSQLKQELLRKFVSEAGMHNLSLGGNYYLCGIARYYFNGDLTSNKRLGLLYPGVRDKFNTEICTRLDALVNILRNAYIDTIGTQWEQPEDFGTLTIQQLLRKYNKKINKELGIEPKKDEEPVANEIQKETFDHKAGKSYTYEIIYNQEDAKKYKKYTEPGAWCIAYAQNHYDTYIRKLGGIHYVVFRQNGFENIPRRVGPGFTKKKPHDAYGNSLICVLQSNRNPEPIYITSRWNHGSTVDGTYGTEADHAYTKEEFLNVIGDDGTVLDTCFREWNENKEKVQNSSEKANLTKKFKNDATRAFKYAQMLISNGKSPLEIFTELEAWTYDKDMEGYFHNFPRHDNTYKKANKAGGVFWCALKVGEDGRMAYALMTNGKILFDIGIFLTDSMGLVNSDCSEENMLFRFRNDQIDKSYVYNRKLKRFLTIDGNNAFKQIGDINKDNKYFIAAIRNNQMALVNSSTLQTVCTPNGEVWFEDIYTTHRFQRDRGYMFLDDIDENAFVSMVYDSSAEEIYVFNAKNERFVDKTITYNGAQFLVSERCVKDYLIVDGRRFLRYSNFEQTQSGWWNRVKSIYVDPQDNTVLNLCGYTEFDALRNDGSHGSDAIIFTLPGDSTSKLIYLTQVGKLLELNGKTKLNKRETMFHCLLSPLYSVCTSEMCFAETIHIINVSTGKYVEREGSYVFREIGWGPLYQPVGGVKEYNIKELME